MIFNKSFLIINDYLILSDPHFGYTDDVSNFLSLDKILFEMIEPYLEKVSFVIINGDLKHHFDKVTRGEWSQVNNFIKKLSARIKVIIIRGNHDTMIKNIAKGCDIKEFIMIKDYFICHGDKLFEIPSYAKKIIIGHQHPCLTLKEGSRNETYKCFLVGKYKEKELIVMPSANPFLIGSDIRKKGIITPYIKKGQVFDVKIVEEDNIFSFGKIVL